ncbi:Protein gts1 [Recurvomyces mirabilis]|uniref:Protein gts1 n=1 Tax=Recurvomyces mirabilis TaxID=574656 RepID=A0AAE1C4C3_9PEZI|nr:Protein gts1 [Recurvomyces mirabilis]KAK5157254.1 Protein gts1 [Recurvomyces mirabilis]
MASAISKRQQARNERMLQDLLRNVPGNDRCADCTAKNPTWASWNLGMFLCERCGGLHRKLGTHVSKVKSLSMDSWSGDQVEHMKKVGNAEGNQRWNPKGVRPDIPVDVDEVDGAIERFIRQKYEQRAFVPGGMGAAAARAPVRQNTGSTETGSWSEEPPPLPPKPGKRFGFSLRSASSTLPKASKHDRNFTPPLSPTFSGNGNDRFDPPSPRNVKAGNKPSQMFGMKIMGVGNNFDAKLATLRDMGFSDSRQNSAVLKGANGNLDRAVETLVRQGEDSKPATPGPRSLTPLSMGSQGAAGITFEKTRQAEKKANSNPWEIREEVPQRSATQPAPEPPRSQSAQPQSNSWNPFLAQTQQAQPQQLVDSFQNLQMSQTGPAPQQYAQSAIYGQQAQNNPFQAVQAPNPWDTSNMSQQIPQHSATDPTYGQQYQQTQQYQQQPAQPLRPQQTSNPFLRRAASQTFAPSNPWGQIPAQPQQHQVAPAQQSGNPFGLPPLPQQQQQQQVQNVLQQPAMQSPAPIYGGQEYFAGQQAQAQSPWQPQQVQPQQTGVNPFFQQQQPQQSQQQMMMPQQTGMPQQHQYLQQPQQQPVALAQQAMEQPWTYHEVTPQPQQRMQMDKSSILGLYGMQSSLPQQQQSLQSISEHGGMQAPQQQQQEQQQQQGYLPQQPQQPQQQQAFQQQPQPQQQQQVQRSVTMPATMQQQQVNGGNPFGAFGQQPQQAFPQGPRHVSNESAAFVGLGGGGGVDGRNSPDAFRGLSSMYAR